MLAVALALVSFQHPAPAAVVNGDFEDGAADQTPAAWAVPTKGYRAEAIANGAEQGNRCAHLWRTDEVSDSPFGNLMQRFDARPWRGTPIRLKAAVRVAGPSARAQMWLRVDREKGRSGLFDNMGDRPVRSSRWSTCEITGLVDPDAEQLNVGVMLIGDGEAWIDAVELAATGETIEFVPIEPPRALTDAGLANLLAYAELFGYVRHFHPSDEAAAADWGEVAVEGVRAVESADSPFALALALQAHFLPLAPTIRVFPRGARGALAPELSSAPEGGRVLRWKHVGFGQTGGVYSSVREKFEARSPIPSGATDPARPYSAELAGGVDCLVPLALHADSGGTLPHAASAPAAAVSAPVHRPSGDDRTTRLADVVIAWNVFQHFYPYFDVTPVDWALELEKALRAAATDADERAFLDTLNRLVAALGDGHGYVRHSMERREGILPLDWDWIEGRLVVTAVAEGIGAHPVRGDVVLSIGGAPVEELLEQAESLISGATPQWIRSRALGELRWRSTPAPCELELATFPDDDRVSVPLTPKRPPFDVRVPLPPKVTELEAGVWYVDLAHVSEDDMENAVEQLADARGIVFDLRGYPGSVRPETIFGHLIEEPVTSQQWHIPLVRLPNREQLEYERGGEWDLEPSEPFFMGKKAFLTGGGAISYAESCMGIVEHYRLADIVGGPTAGTNGNVNPFELPGGYGISWTGMKVLKHDGSRHHGVGIQPTIPVQRTRRGVAEGRDEVLERAVAAVRR